MGVLHEVLRERSVEGEVLPLVFLHLTVVDQTCEEHCCEERYADTDDEGGSEATDRTCTEDIEYDTGDE